MSVIFTRYEADRLILLLEDYIFLSGAPENIVSARAFQDKLVGYIEKEDAFDE